MPTYSVNTACCYRPTEFPRVTLLSGPSHLIRDLHRSEEISSQPFRLTALLFRFHEVVAVRHVPVRGCIALVD